MDKSIPHCLEHNKEAAVNRIIAFFDQISNKVDICKNFNNNTGKYHLLYELFLYELMDLSNWWNKKKLKIRIKKKIQNKYWEISAAL